MVGMIVASSTHHTVCTPNCVAPTCPCFSVLPGVSPFPTALESHVWKSYFVDFWQGVTYNNITGTISGSPNGSYFVNSTICLTSCGSPVCAKPTCDAKRWYIDLGSRTGELFLTSFCPLRFVTSAEIDAAPWITFLWRHTFGLGFYAPAVLPMLFGFMVTTMVRILICHSNLSFYTGQINTCSYSQECIGDITATTEASDLLPIGKDKVTPS